MERKSLFLMLAMVALLPLTAVGQVAPDKTPSPTNEPSYKYYAFVGWGYTSLNQVNQSRSGLQGYNVNVTRNLKKYFGLSVDGAHYAWTVLHANPQPATVDLYLAGPEFHGQLYGPISVFARGMIGAAHTGQVQIRPKYSFAGGVGMGADYRLTSRMAIRLSGDFIGSSFTIVPYQTGDSPHRRFNGRASFGLVYRF